MARDNAYREAEKKIEEARQLGAKELNLAGIGLIELPESLGQLTQLKSFHLFGNQLTTLPESITQLTKLSSERRFNAKDQLPQTGFRSL